jgi:NAD(P)-dependent dehydrogenase (short-subunit alcohol dehydrogenase family)
VIRVHLYGSYHVSRAAAHHFKEQNGGAFVHMTSTSGLIGNLGQANYNAAKMGIAALSKSIALDMQKFNEPAAPGALGSPPARLDRAEPGRARHAGAEGRLRAHGTFSGRVQLGSHLNAAPPADLPSAGRTVHAG